MDTGNSKLLLNKSAVKGVLAWLNGNSGRSVEEHFFEHFARVRSSEFAVLNLLCLLKQCAKAPHVGRSVQKITFIGWNLSRS